MKVNLGCGNRPLKGFFNVDYDEDCKPDMIVNLNERFPWDDNTVDEVYTSHVAEHVKDIFDFMYEIWRVCKHGSRVTVVVPACYSWHFAIAPDHVRYFRIGYFEMWLPRLLCGNRDIVQNHHKMTKGAEFAISGEQLFNEGREIMFNLIVQKDHGEQAMTKFLETGQSQNEVERK